MRFDLQTQSQSRQALRMFLHSNRNAETSIKGSRGAHTLQLDHRALAGRAEQRHLSSKVNIGPRLIHAAVTQQVYSAAVTEDRGPRTHFMD